MFGASAHEITQLAEILEIGLNSIVADIGAGEGDYTFPISKIAHKVFAVEIDSEKIKQLQKIVNDSQKSNVEVVESKVSTTNLFPLSCDAAFFSSSYHHVQKPEEFDASLYSALKPGAKVMIIDFPPNRMLSFFSPVHGVPKNRGGHGIKKSFVIEEMSAAGFKFKTETGFWARGRYGLLFEKIKPVL